MDKTKIWNIVSRIFSIILAILLWGYVISEDNPISSVDIANIKVNLINTEAINAAGYKLIDNPDNYTIKLYVKGRKNDIKSIKAQDFVAEANLALPYYVKGANSVSVILKDWPQNIEIQNKAITINVELDEIVTRSFPIKSSIIGKLQEGYINEMPIFKQNEITLIGASRDIGSVFSVVALIDIKEKTKEFTASVPVQVLDKNNNIIQGIDVKPEKIDVTVPIKMAKEVPINIKTSGNLPLGVVVKGMTANPKTIKIVGDENIISTINSIDTLNISLDEINSDVVKNIKLNIPQNVVVQNDIQSINIDIKVEKTISKLFNVPVKYINLPDGLNAEVITNNINVTLSGIENLFSSITVNDIIATIDLSNLYKEDGEYEITPSVKYPQNVNVKLIQPEKVKVKITKKQG